MTQVYVYKMSRSDVVVSEWMQKPEKVLDNSSFKSNDLVKVNDYNTITIFVNY